jgi:hypothetical protein
LCYEPECWALTENEDDFADFYETMPPQYQRKIPLDNDNRRNSVGAVLLGSQPTNPILYKMLDIPNWSPNEHQQNSDIETILKMLFSPRNSHFHRDYRSRAGTPRGSFENSFKSGVQEFRSFGEMYHSQRRNTLGALGVIRRESFQLQILRDQVRFLHHLWRKVVYV